MKEYRLNMLSRADMVKGQGVLSAYEEELRLISGRLDRIHGDSGDFKLNISINDKIDGDITHIHTVNPEFFLRLPAIKSKGIAVGSVHFLPETVDQSLHLPSVARQAFYSYLISFYKSMDRLVTVNPCFIPKLAPTASTRRRSPSSKLCFGQRLFNGGPPTGQGASQQLGTGPGALYRCLCRSAANSQRGAGVCADCQGTAADAVCVGGRFCLRRDERRTQGAGKAAARPFGQPVLHRAD